MDDTAQKSQNDVTSLPVASVQQSAPQPVGTMHKEAAPLLTEHHVIAPAPHESEPQISQEVAKHVEQSQDHEKLNLTNQQKALGVTEAKESVPAPTVASDNVTYPMTKEEIVLSQKLPPADPVRWLGALILRQWKKAHQAIQKNNHE